MFLYIVLAVVGFLVLLFAWGFVRIRRGTAQATQAIRELRLEEIAGLVAEGKEGVRKALGVTLDLADREAAARALDDLFTDSMKLKDTFAAEGFYWRFALPVGALLGEFMRIHAKGQWTATDDGPAMEIAMKDGSATCFPFDKALKQALGGAQGDIYAFLMGAMELPSATA